MLKRRVKREEQVLRYFNKIKPWMTIILTIALICSVGFNLYLFLFLKKLNLTYFILSLISAGISIIVITLIIIQPKIDKFGDIEYNKLVKEDYDEIFNEYILKHNDYVITDPIVSYSLTRYPSCTDNDYVYSKKLALWQASHSKCDIILFKEKSLILYHVYINHITGNRGFIEYKELFYDKLSSVSYETRVEKIDNRVHDIIDLKINTTCNEMAVFNIRNSWASPQKININYLIYVYLYNHLWIMISINNLVMSMLFLILYFIFSFSLLFSVLGMLMIVLVWLILIFVDVSKKIKVEPNVMNENEKNMLDNLINMINKVKKNEF